MNMKNQNDVLDLYSFTGKKSHGHLCLLSAAQVEKEQWNVPRKITSNAFIWTVMFEEIRKLFL